MKKWIITIILMFVMIQIATATECQMSMDNITFTDITDLGGSIDEGNKFGALPLLNESTLYYFRCKDATSSWGYNSTTTESGGDDSNMIYSSLIYLFMFFAVLVCVGIYRSDKNYIKVILSAVLSLIIVVLMRFSSWFVTILYPAEVELINTLDHFYQWSIWGFIFSLLFCMFMLVIIVLNVMSDKKKKSKDMDNWDNG